MEDVLKPPSSLLATDRSKAVVLVWFLLIVFWSRCFVSYLYFFVVYLYVKVDGSIASVGEEGAVCLLLFVCGYVVSVWRGFLFLWVLWMGYVVLL